MNIQKQGAFALALALGLFGAHGAQAQLLGASTDIRLETGMGSGTLPLLTATTSADAQIGADLGQETAATTSSSVNGTLGFSFERRDLDDGTAYSVSDAEDVQTAAGLESYAAASVRDDDRLESAKLSDGTLTVTYRTDAKFLGFIPGSIRVTAMTDADGNVTVRYPWYAFLMPTYESRAELEVRLTKEQGSIRNQLAEVAVGGEARQWALMLERLRSSLYASASAEARR